MSEEDIYDDEYDEEAEEEDENLYEERKSFLYAEYPKIEEYLQRKSNEGYHFVRHEGKKYYFKVRTMKKVSGKYRYSSFSKVRSIKR